VPKFDRGALDQSSGIRSAANRQGNGSARSTAPSPSARQPQTAPPPQDDLYPGDNEAAYQRPEEPPPRMASARTTAAASFDEELSRRGSTFRETRQSEEASPQFPPFWIAVCIFALFFSVGGNFYLAWTAAEFYSRYKLAVERLRSAGR
jgi:hypothetical protein